MLAGTHTLKKVNWHQNKLTLKPGRPRWSQKGHGKHLPYTLPTAERGDKMRPPPDSSTRAMRNPTSPAATSASFPARWLLWDSDHLQTKAPPHSHLSQPFLATAELWAPAGSAKISLLPPSSPKIKCTFFIIVKTFPYKFYCSPHCSQQHSCSHLLPAHEQAAAASPNHRASETRQEGLCSPVQSWDVPVLQALCHPQLHDLLHSPSCSHPAISAPLSLSSSLSLSPSIQCCKS